MTKLRKEWQGAVDAVKPRAVIRDGVLMFDEIDVNNLAHRLQELADKERWEAFEAAKAYQDLATCYRIGKRPSEALFTRLEKAGDYLKSQEGK